MLRCVGKYVLIISLIAVLSLSTGCGKWSGQMLKKPAPGGNLVYGSLQKPDNLNPLLSDMVATQEIGSLVFSGLVLENSKGEWIGDLAIDVPSRENGEVSPDGLTVTYKLRQGVKWHDGAPFSAEDVKFTWQTIMNPNVNIVSKSGYDKISAIDTPDSNTVVVYYKEFYPPFLTLFRTILPKHLLEKEADINKAAFNRMPVGTGPFKLMVWNMTGELVFEANLDYFRGRPNLDQIIYKIIPEANLVLSQLEAREVDIIGNIPFSLYEQVKAISGVKAMLTPSMVWEHLDFNLDNALLSDAKVRQAIMLGIDRRAIVSGVLKGGGSPAAGDQSPLSWAYNPVLSVPGRDVNAARSLLTQAGWQQDSDGIFAKDGRKLILGLVTTGDNNVRESVARIIEQQLKEVGIGVNVQLVKPEVLFAEVLKNRRFEMALYAWVNGVDPDNTNLWHSKNIPGSHNGYKGQNYPGWRNAEVDRLVERGVHTYNLEERKQIYFALQQLIIDDVPVIPLYFRANIDAMRDTVINFSPNPMSGNTWNVWEWGLTKKK
ncbi:MAG: ABC-type transporter, periplasmic subunit [Firmicutes bacterium]|nr:ABC-type transporter, periplasmic subunit [Bacillota bacterium]